MSPFLVLKVRGGGNVGEILKEVSIGKGPFVTTSGI
jgi:hypothetical protein